jgi:solute carrier family 1 (neuronal/epithelial high affinity glutamate transporter), member 1
LSDHLVPAVEGIGHSVTRRQSNIILVGIVIGILCACVSLPIFGEKMKSVKVLGDFFLNALKMIIVPLVVASVVVGITGLGDVRRLGRVGLRTILYYAVTTSIAVAIGIVAVGIMQPGVDVSTEGIVTPEDVQAKRELGWTDIVLSFVGKNIFASLSDMQMLPTIVFSLVFGGVLTTIGEKGKPVIAFFDAVNDVIMKMVHLIMWIAPVGVFGLVAYQLAAAEDWDSILAGLGKYMATVLIGLAVHAFVVLPILCMVLGRRNPLGHFLAMIPAILTAWSTASSSATLPLTLDCAEERAGLSKRAAGFVLPLGATINMDGTALYESVAAIFIAQAYGIPLSFGDVVLIFITATLASIGAAGIPQAGLFTMIIVLTAVDLPLEGVGLLLAVDWLLDRFRTAVNVWGDSVGVAYIDRVTDVDELATRAGGARGASVG